MSTITVLARRTARVLAVGALAVGLGVGVAVPASAAPPQSDSSLAIAKAGYSRTYKAYVNGVWPMSESQAYVFLRQLRGINIQLLGDDPGTADPVRISDFGLRSSSLPGQVPGQFLFAAPDGLHFHREFAVPASALDEDSGYFDDTDEIYAQATLIDSNQQGRLRATSNVIIRNF